MLRLDFEAAAWRKPQTVRARLSSQPSPSPPCRGNTRPVWIGNARRVWPRRWRSQLLPVPGPRPDRPRPRAISRPYTLRKPLPYPVQDRDLVCAHAVSLSGVEAVDAHRTNSRRALHARGARRNRTIKECPRILPSAAALCLNRSSLSRLASSSRMPVGRQSVSRHARGRDQCRP
jgi:hypothetical protein